jgi:hypothetical protein
MMQSDREILREYLELMNAPYPTDEKREETLLVFVRKARAAEPRINNGSHLIDFTLISDEDDTMETFYGPEYFKQ